jgi:predicted permease
VPGLRGEDELRGPENGILEAIGRLAAGVSTTAAATALSSVADRFSQDVGGAQPGNYTVRIERWAAVPAAGRGAATALFAVLMTAVALMLAVACVNVAGMFLSRSAERSGEIALRRALGASQSRVARQLLTESLLVFLAGGLLGVLVSMWATRLLLAFEPPLPPGFAIDLDLSPDARVIGFSLAVTIVALIVFNLAPAVHAARPDLTDAMRRRGESGGRRRTRARSFLVGGQMAGAMVLLVVAGLFVRALSSLDTLDPGWDADGVLAADIDLELTGTESDPGSAFYRELAARVAELPGVQSSGLAGKLPLAGSSSWGDVAIAGFEPPAGRSGFPAYLNRVSPGYFETLRMPLVQGRDFDDSDSDGPPVAIVNRAMADRFWPGGEAIGQRFSLARGDEFTVVGVVENAKYRRLVEETPNFYYVPGSRWYNAQMSLLVRTRPGMDAPVRDGVARIVRELQPDLPVQPAGTLAARLEPFFLPQRIGAWVTGIVGLIGLLLGAVGVYGTTAFAVSQRTREMGVRIALGARADEVLALVVRQGMKAPAWGVAAGLAVALVVARLMRGLLAQVSALDGVAFAGALTTLLAVALAAAYVPARRAVRANPLDSLRAD